MAKLVLIIFGAFLVNFASCNWVRNTTSLREIVLELRAQLELINKQLTRSVPDIFNHEYKHVAIDVHDALEMHAKYLNQTAKFFNETDKHSKPLDRIFGKNITIEEKAFKKINVTCCEKLVKKIEQINKNMTQKLLQNFDKKAAEIARLHQPWLGANCNDYPIHKKNQMIMHGALVALNLEAVLLHIYENWASTFGNYRGCFAQIDRVANATQEILNLQDRIPHKMNICESILIRRSSPEYQFFIKFWAFFVDNKERLCFWKDRGVWVR